MPSITLTFNTSGQANYYWASKPHSVYITNSTASDIQVDVLGTGSFSMISSNNYKDWSYDDLRAITTWTGYLFATGGSEGDTIEVTF